MAESNSDFADRQLAAVFGTTAGPLKVALHISGPAGALPVVEYGALFQGLERSLIGDLMMMLDRIVAGTNIAPDDCRFVLPPDLLPGLTHVYGIVIVRSYIAEPLVAVRLPR